MAARKQQRLKVRVIQWAEMDFVRQILDGMEARGVTRVQLADRLGVAPAYVTRLLSGTANLTIKTMVRMCAAVGAGLDIRVVPRKGNEVEK